MSCTYINIHKSFYTFTDFDFKFNGILYYYIMVCVGTNSKRSYILDNG